MSRYVKLKARVPVVTRGLSTFYEEEGVFKLDDVVFLSHGVMYACVLSPVTGKFVSGFGPVRQEHVTVLEYIGS